MPKKKSCYMEGLMAAESGKPMAMCPYTILSKWTEWRTGWMDGANNQMRKAESENPTPRGDKS